MYGVLELHIYQQEINKDMKNLQKNYIAKDIISKQLERFSFHPYTFTHYIQSHPTKLRNEALVHFKMLILLHGAFDIISNRKQYHVSIPGTIIIIEPILLFDLSIRENSGVEFYYIDFDITSNSDISEMTSILRPQPIILDDMNHELILSLFAEIDKKIIHKSAGNYYMVKSLLEYIIAMVWRTYVNQLPNFHFFDLEKTPQEKIVLGCVNFLNRNMNRYVSVNELCQAVNVSQSYLYQCFMSTLNCSTKDFLTSYKLRRIAYDLVQNQLSIEELARKYGFTSIYSFSTTFKKYFGISPLKYRKEWLLKDQVKDYENNS